MCLYILLFVKVWGFVVVKDETRLITGCSDSELRVWRISGIEGDAEESPKDSEKHGSKRSAKEAELNDESQEKTDEVRVKIYGPTEGRKFCCESLS